MMNDLHVTSEINIKTKLSCNVKTKRAVCYLHVIKDRSISMIYKVGIGICLNLGLFFVI